MRYRAGNLILPRRTEQYLLNGAAEGTRNAELFAAACQLRDAGVSQEEAEAQLLPRACADGLSQSEAQATIRSAYTHQPRAPLFGGRAQVPRPQTPIQDGFLKLLDICFRPGEYVAIADAVEEDDKVVPRRGVTMTVEEWRERVTRKGGIDKCFTNKNGLFVRINPVRRGGAKNEDVTAHRHVLVEFDQTTDGQAISKDAQWKAIVESKLPISVVIDSGNRSLHAWVRVDAPDAGEYRRRVDVIWRWFDGHNLDKQNRNPSRLSRCPDGWRMVNGQPVQQRLLATNLGMQSWAEWEAQSATDGLPQIISATEFMAQPRPEPPQLIKGILHQGCKMIIGGASKARKSWAMIDLMLSVSTGTSWWGFETAAGRALYINFELPEFAFQHRIAAIAKAKGIDNWDAIDLWNLRGYATDFSVLIPKILGRIKSGGYSLIILDPIYKGLGARDENKAGDIASLCNEIEQLAVQSGAAVVFGAHFSKGNQSAKDAIDRIGGSGVFARDPDVILTMTPHENKDTYVVDLTLRALPPVESFVVRWAGAIFERDGDANPTALRRVGESGKTNKATYRTGSVAATYGALLEDMPPLKHHRDPEQSEVLRYIMTKVAQTEGECSLKQAQRIYYCLANMRGNGPIIYDSTVRMWRGRNFNQDKTS